MTPDIDTPIETPTDESSIELDHALIENEDAPDECALFPREVSEDELSTAWIVAHDDGFVSLDTMR
ncbi:DUF7511 domain-containing protein [Natronolimnohabitans innermongolicus]|uniref:DUF7511 domain-containing protein n=1 Tax=Natronolimnohabitans innermongolicus JCM 12255 TaxID=1227499 RepID=L9XBK1_9EURY|nr:hypothetical protein [Natronolimnohabitans innermongolicus]ELY59105.1 hypothetical protein C493_05625 [Natronolimnohabitans innermongolicus JCM 12255]